MAAERLAVLAGVPLGVESSEIPTGEQEHVSVTMTFCGTLAAELNLPLDVRTS